MKHQITVAFAAIFMFCIFMGTPVMANSVTFGTAVAGGSEGNTTTGTNLITIPAGAWAPAIAGSQWESIQVDSLHPVIPNGTIVDFYFNFNLIGSPTGGNISVLVDDSATLEVNGHVIANNIGSPDGAHCSATLPNCTMVDNLSIPSIDLLSGANRVDVIVEQTNNNQFGLDVLGTANATPEPASCVAIGTGLVMLALRKRAR